MYDIVESTKWDSTIFVTIYFIHRGVDMVRKDKIFEYLYWELLLNIIIGIGVSNANINIYFICIYLSIIDYLFAKHICLSLKNPLKLFSLIILYSFIAILSHIVPLLYIQLRDYFQDGFWSPVAFQMFLVFCVGYFIMQFLLKWGMLSIFVGSLKLTSEKIEKK